MPSSALVVSVPAAEVGAVAVEIVAGVGGHWGGSWAKSTALGTAGADCRLVARVLSKAGTVAVHVITRRLSGDRGIRGSSNSLTFRHSHCLVNSTYTHTSLEPDEAVLAP